MAEQLTADELARVKQVGQAIVMALQKVLLERFKDHHQDPNSEWQKPAQQEYFQTALGIINGEPLAVRIAMEAYVDDVCKSTWNAMFLSLKNSTGNDATLARSALQAAVEKGERLIRLEADQETCEASL